MLSYLNYFLQRLWWVVSNLILIHLELVSIYFFALSSWIQGDRVLDITLKAVTYTGYQKYKLEEHMCEDEEAQALGSEE